jgi:hypothetical protein
MLSDSESPVQQTSYPLSRPSGPPPRELYHSPPFRRVQPSNYNGHRNTRSFGRDIPDYCEDITAYALGIVKSLEIPEDERCEKEEFCRDLSEIVQNIRPSISPDKYFY